MALELGYLKGGYVNFCFSILNYIFAIYGNLHSLLSQLAKSRLILLNVLTPQCLDLLLVAVYVMFIKFAGSVLI